VKGIRFKQYVYTGSQNRAVYLSLGNIKPLGRKSLFLFEESDVLEKDILSIYYRNTSMAKMISG
jgi:hypothetical protein